MTGKHIRRKKHILRFVIGILVVGLGIFCYFHFCDDQEIDLSQYETMVGTIKNVGDETLLIENKKETIPSLIGIVLGILIQYFI